MTSHLGAAVLALCLTGCEGPAAAGGAQTGPRSKAPAGFWEHWGDGRAELAAYRLTQSRYGQLRQGEAVLVTVTEDLTKAQRVKSNGGHGDEFPVLKLNEVRDFQTGVYDYNLMTSTFLPLDGSTPLGVPTKLSFSMQEWCGMTFDQLVIDGASYTRQAHSYFDGEGDRVETAPIPAGAVFADALPLLVRGLTGELVAPGESRELAILPRLSAVRMSHRPLAWTMATLTRSEAPVAVESVLGAIPATELTVDVEGGVRTTYVVEVAPPHRLLSWRASDGEEAVLTGLQREPYWNESDNGQESRRTALGLPAPVWP